MHVDRAHDRIVLRPHVTVRSLDVPEVAFAPQIQAAYTVVAVLDGTLVGSVGGAPLALRAGETALVGPGQVYEIRAVASRLVSIAIDPTLIEELLVEVGWYHPDAHPDVRTNVVADPVLQRLAESVAIEVEEERPGQGAMLDALARQLGVHLLRTHLVVRRMPAIEWSRAGPVDRRLRRAIELMHARPGEELSLKDLAGAAFLSEFYFARLFKEITGLTPHAYLANVRIERARALLAQTDLPVTRIAAEVGYRSPGHFARAFRAIVGLSPRAYRAAAHAPPRSTRPEVRNRPRATARNGKQAGARPG